MSTLSLNAYREQVAIGKDLPKIYHVYRVISNGPGNSLTTLRRLQFDLVNDHETNKKEK